VYVDIDVYMLYVYNTPDTTGQSTHCSVLVVPVHTGLKRGNTSLGTALNGRPSIRFCGWRWGRKDWFEIQDMQGAASRSWASSSQV